jgi:cell division protease FtsH
LPGGRILHKVSIVPRGNVLGATWLPESDEQLLHTRSLLIERMATLLAGRVAEQLIFGQCSDGAGNDLAQVGAIARRMVVRFGMSEALGPLSYADDDGMGGRSQYSDETARLIDSETRRLVEQAEGLAHDVLGRSRAELDRVAEALLERETLSLEEVERIAGPAPVLQR